MATEACGALGCEPIGHSRNIDMAPKFEKSKLFGLEKRLLSCCEACLSLVFLHFLAPKRVTAMLQVSWAAWCILRLSGERVDP